MSNRNTQLSFVNPRLQRFSDTFGGSQLKSNPKTQRPLDSKLPIHLVLRARKSGMRSPKALAQVQQAIQRAAKRHGVKIFEQANVGNHIHLLIKITRRARWNGFIREITGRIAQLMKGLGFGEIGQSFWLNRPFTRVVRGWKKAFQIARDYVYLNQLEAEGWISRKETKNLRDLRAIWSDA